MDILLLAVICLAVIILIYPLLLVLSIANLLRKYLKCKIRESEWQLFLFDQQNKID